ncbi:zinc ribbon domain-containing protein [Pseudoduganella sp. UC29_106]|uniref:zinc ribbon domain-containing protein n=1 Tax=Pseudoduganella sp. UC29_106 TaxID=3374553 RepID=UPI003756B96F
MTALGLLCVVAGASATFLASKHILDGEPVASIIAFAVSQFGVGLFCLNSAHVLWGRFDFVSELIWVDISGSYESARVNVGNQVTSQVHSSKNVINIESMTMRVWVSEIDTVIFGKDSFRQMVGMRGLPVFAEELARSLKGFGETCSSIVAPSSQQDLERARNLAVVGQVMGGEDPLGLVEKLSLKTEAAPSAPAAAVVAAVLPGCKQCGAGLEPDDRFCGDCGAAV